MRLSKAEIDKLEKVTGQLDGLHKEISALARKSPNDALNKFKLKFINAVIAEANDVLGQEYLPLSGFNAFDPDDVPSNSDVTMILGLYSEELERKRAGAIKKKVGNIWVYDASDVANPSLDIRTAPPKKISERK